MPCYPQKAICTPLSGFADCSNLAPSQPVTLCSLFLFPYSCYYDVLPHHGSSVLKPPGQRLKPQTLWAKLNLSSSNYMRTFSPELSHWASAVACSCMTSSVEMPIYADSIMSCSFWRNLSTKFPLSYVTRNEISSWHITCQIMCHICKEHACLNVGSQFVIFKKLTLSLS